MVRAVVDAARPSTGATPGSGGRANVSNPTANAGGAALRVDGGALVAVAVVQQASEIANSPEPAKEVAGAGGMVLGGIAGGEAGVAVGTVVGGLIGGPAGAGAGAIIGGIVGSAGGGYAGEQGAEKLYDKTRELQ